MTNSVLSFEPPMLNCNSQRAEGLQEAFFPPPCSSGTDRLQGSYSINTQQQQQILGPSVVVVPLDALGAFQDSPNSSSQEIQTSQDSNLHTRKPAGGSLNLQVFGEDHPMFGTVVNVNNAHAGSMGGLDLLGAIDPCDHHLKFAGIDTWNSLQLAAVPSSLHHHHATTTSYRNLLTSSSGLIMEPLSLDFGAAPGSGSLDHVACPAPAATQSPTIFERGAGMRMDTSCRDSDSSNSSQQSFQSRLMSEPSMNLNLQHSSSQTGGIGAGMPLHIRKGTSFDTGLGLNLHHGHPRFDYNPTPQLMNLESASFMTHGVENQIHLGTPVDRAALCGGGRHLNAYNLGGGSGMSTTRLPADHGLTQISQILPSKAAKASMATQFSPPAHPNVNFLFGSSLTAPPAGCNALKLPTLNFKYNPKVDPASLHFFDSGLKLLDGYTASQQSSATDGRPAGPLKKEHTEFNISFRGARHVVSSLKHYDISQMVRTVYMHTCIHV